MNESDLEPFHRNKISENLQKKLRCQYCHSLVLILILISIKTGSDNIFGQKPPPHNPTGTQPCLILPKLLTFKVIH